MLSAIFMMCGNISIFGKQHKIFFRIKLNDYSWVFFFLSECNGFHCSNGSFSILYPFKLSLKIAKLSDSDVFYGSWIQVFSSIPESIVRIFVCIYLYYYPLSNLLQIFFHNSIQLHTYESCCNNDIIALKNMFIKTRTLLIAPGVWFLKCFVRCSNKTRT